MADHFYAQLARCANPIIRLIVTSTLRIYKLSNVSRLAACSLTQRSLLADMGHAWGLPIHQAAQRWVSSPSRQRIRERELAGARLCGRPLDRHASSFPPLKSQSHALAYIEIATSTCLTMERSTILRDRRSIQSSSGSSVQAFPLLYHTPCTQHGGLFIAHPHSPLSPPSLSSIFMPAPLPHTPPFLLALCLCSSLCSHRHTCRRTHAHLHWCALFAGRHLHHPTDDAGILIPRPLQRNHTGLCRGPVHTRQQATACLGVHQDGPGLGGTLRHLRAQSSKGMVFCALKACQPSVAWTARIRGKPPCRLPPI